VRWCGQADGHTNEFGTKERFNSAPLTVEGKVLVANGVSTGSRAGSQRSMRAPEQLWRWYAVPAPGEPGSETWKDKTSAWKTGGGGMWQTGSTIRRRGSRSGGTGNRRRTTTRWRVRRQSLHPTPGCALDIDTGKLAGISIYPNDSWTTTRSASTTLHDVTINGETRKAVSHFARQWFLLQRSTRNNGSFIAGSQYVNDLNWTRTRPEDRQTVEYNPGLDVQR